MRRHQTIEVLLQLYVPPAGVTVEFLRQKLDRFSTRELKRVRRKLEQHAYECLTFGGGPVTGREIFLAETKAMGGEAAQAVERFVVFNERARAWAEAAYAQQFIARQKAEDAAKNH